MTDQQPPSEPPSDYQKWLHEIQRQDAHRAHDRNAQFFENINEATVKSADAALRAALLINGGAAVAVLAFIGGLVSQDRIQLNQLNDVASSLMFFALGVAAAVAAMGLSYVTNYVTATHAKSFVRWWQYPYLREGADTQKIARLKNVLHIAAALVGFSSLALFIVGMIDVRNAILMMSATPK